MAISRISAQDNAVSINTNNQVISYPSFTTSGNLLIAAFNANTAAGSLGISTSGWTLFKETWRTNFAMVVAWKISAGEQTFTLSVTGETAGTLVCYEYTGNNATQPDANASIPSGNNNGTSTVTNWTTPSISTNNANDLIFSAVSGDGSLSGFGWTTSTLLAGGVNTYTINAGEYIVSSTQSSFTDKLSWTGNSAGASAITFAFQAAASAATGITGQFLMTAI